MADSPSPSAALKYLILYPFLPLTIAKIFSCTMHVLSVLLWQAAPSTSTLHTTLVFSPILDIISTAILLVSLWFTAQKFYLKKLEVSFNGVGLLLSLYSTLLLLSYSNGQKTLLHNILYNHVLASLSWLFCLLWSSTATSNTLSKLFISEWGEGVEDIEIECLQDHF